MSKELLLDANNYDNFSDKEKLLLKGVKEYFKKEKRLKILLGFLLGTETIALRVLDWFITNYCKKRIVTYKIKIDNKQKNFNVYLSYLKQLDTHSKQYFDPFCRREKKNLTKIIFHYIDPDSQKDKSIITTIGQLIFFKWAITYRIIDYVKENYDTIVSDQKNNSKTRCIESEKHVKHKKKDISSASSNTDFCLSEGTNKILGFDLSDKKNSIEKKRKKRRELTPSIYKNIIIDKEIDFD